MQVYQSLKLVKVNDPYTYNYAGMFDHNRIISEIMKVVHVCANVDNDRQLKENICQFLDVVSNVQQSDAVWVTVRLTSVNNRFQIPRWHKDGRMFTDAAAPIQTKYAVAMYGPGTLTLRETPAISQIMTIWGNAREILARELSSAQPLHIETGQIFSFQCGGKDALIHSEPDMVSDRLFMSAVPGTEAQIKDLALIRKLEFMN